MGEGVIDDSKWPPKAREALRKAQVILKGMEATTNYLQARQRVREELPDGLARDIVLESVDFAYRMQIENLTRPRLNLEGGVVVGINQREPAP